MIIRIQASGGSFRGAGAYYLHDKAAAAGIDTGRLQGGQLQAQENALKPTSAERVWFTETRNCMNHDPFRALDEMWGVAADQDWLKMQAGVKRGGRVCESPVKTIAMSWHRADAPSPEHMIESADAFLKHMGWQEHQAVIVGHDDTDHKHLHIILNRVHPETGRTLDDYREQKRAQEWALQYERAHDQVRCDAREANAARQAERKAERKDAGQDQTRQAANDHLPHNVIELTRPLEQQFMADELQRAARQLKVEQRDERKEFFADGAKLFKATRAAAYKEVREEFKAEWRDYYAQARAAGLEMEKGSDNAIRSAEYFAFANQWERAREVFDGRHADRETIVAELRERKADILARQGAAIAERQHDACDALREIREVQYQELLKRQAAERAALQAGITLEAAGVRQERDHDASAILWAQLPANENAQRSAAASGAPPSQIAAAKPPVEVGRVVAEEAGTHIEVPSAPGRGEEQAAPSHQLADLAAGAIGSLASYVADQLGEMFAPTPPEVRDARAKADAKREAEQPARQAPESEFDKILAATVKSVEAERSQQDAAYWKERDRGKGWERDQ